MEITMKGVKLETLCLDHAQALYDLTMANHSHLREWLPWLDYIKSCADTRNFITSITTPGAPPHFIILFDDVICGIAGFHEIKTQPKIGSIGYWLGKEHLGKGIITTAVQELMKIGFALPLNKIEIRCAEYNIKSRAIPERLGFTYEATLRDCEWLYSKYVNHAVYSMLASEYLIKK